MPPHGSAKPAYPPQSVRARNPAAPLCPQVLRAGYSPALSIELDLRTMQPSSVAPAAATRSADLRHCTVADAPASLWSAYTDSLTAAVESLVGADGHDECTGGGGGGGVDGDGGGDGDVDAQVHRVQSMHTAACACACACLVACTRKSVRARAHARARAFASLHLRTAVSDFAPKVAQTGHIGQ
jgi:hypothetical protein